MPAQLGEHVLIGLDRDDVGAEPTQRPGQDAGPAPRSATRGGAPVPLTGSRHQRIAASA